MPKRKKPPEKPEDQFKRFLGAAREREVDEAEAGKVFKKLARGMAAKPKTKR